MNRGRDRWSWVGIWIVGATAAIWSFSSLSDLAVLVGITDTFTLAGVTAHISWGLPLTVDVLAVVATRIWLRGTAPVAAVRYAMRAAWAAIAASILGNAYHGWLSGDGRLDSVIVSAVPACVIGALVHLAVLVARPEPVPDMPGSQPALARPYLVTSQPDASPASTRQPASRAKVANLADRAAPLIDQGYGRGRLADALGIEPHEARQLIKNARDEAR